MSEAPALTSILHPTDFSVGSERAFVHALRIATAVRGDLQFTILHAEEREEYGRHWSDFPGVRATLERWGLLPPGSAREDVLATLGIAVERVAALGSDVVGTIEGFTAAHPVDLIVVATRGRSGLPRWLEPSVAERLALRSRVPTLFVPHAARGFVAPEDGQVTLRNVLVPIATEPSPHAAVAAATALAERLTDEPVRMVALHVGEALGAPSLRLTSDSRLDWQYVSREGPVVETILAAAQEFEADLIAMSTRGHHGFLDALRGSTTEQIVRRAACPVLAAPLRS